MKHTAAVITLAGSVVATSWYASNNFDVKHPSKTLHTSSQPTAPTNQNTITSFHQPLVSPIKFTPACTGGNATFEIDGQQYTGIINVVQTDVNGQVRLGGEFAHGTFCFAVQPDSTTSGMVIIPRKRQCHVMNSAKENEPVEWHTQHISNVMCVDLLDAQGGAVDADTSLNSTSNAIVPLLNSKPGARTVLMLDFNGGKIQDPLWNGGRTIDASSSGYNAQQIRTVFDVVAERYSMFNINVTTDVKAYLQAPIKNRMRVMLTTTNFIKGFSGYAFIGSMTRAGTGVFAPNTVSWVFTNMISSAKNAGEICAHELGHTLGLSHDGTTTTAYYPGHGRWGSVMGSSFGKTVVQWSRGEYNRANNTQDDVSIIANTPGVGYNSSTSVLQPGTSNVISRPTDVHVYNVNVVKSGTLNLQAIPGAYSGVDVVMELKRGNNTLMISNSAGRNDAFINLPLNQGTYQVQVRPTGDGDARVNGYSVYGSLGTYILTGTIR